jgi:hypothetical protein
MHDDRGICWFCGTCRSNVTTTSTSQKLAAIDEKVQLLLDLSMDQVNATTTGISKPGSTTLSKPWNELFGKLDNVNNAVDSMRQTFTSSTTKKDIHTVDNDTTRSVVVYGLPESSDTHDTSLVEQLIHSLDPNLSISKFRRLKSKRVSHQASIYTGPVPVLIVLATEFDQRKLLSLAPKLRSSANYKHVFIKQALSTEEQLQLSKLRKQCHDLNDANFLSDPDYATKLVVLDGKVRVSTKQSDGKWKPDWKNVIEANQIFDFALPPNTTS